MARIFVIGLALLAVFSAHALGTQSYQFLVNENGQALVLVSINGTGLHSLNLPGDVEEFKVKGALYILENSSLELSVGADGMAIVVFMTDTLTSKNKDSWSFGFGSENASRIELNLPENAMVTGTSPKAYVENNGLIRLTWEGAGPVGAEYSLASQQAALPDSFGKALQGNTGGYIQSSWLAAAALLAALLVVGTGAYYFSKRESKKAHIIRTLPKNEALIVSLIGKSEGGIKRNTLERQSKLAKSSLAASLNNLEKKNIVEVERSFSVHYVRFTNWFRTL